VEEFSLRPEPQVKPGAVSPARQPNYFVSQPASSPQATKKIHMQPALVSQRGSCSGARICA